MSNRLLPLANWLPAARLALALATARYTRCPDPLPPAMALVFLCHFAANPEWEKGKPRCPPLPPSRAPPTSAVQGGLPHPANRGTPDSLEERRARRCQRPVVSRWASGAHAEGEGLANNTHSRWPIVVEILSSLRTPAGPPSRRESVSGQDRASVGAAISIYEHAARNAICERGE